MSDYPCPKCGGTDRHQPSPGRRIGRCKKCQNEANAKRRQRPPVSPFECISTGCTNRSRAITRPGLCNSCGSRRSTGAAPKFPVDPLLDYMERHGETWRGKQIPERGGRISLERMDEVCCDWLKVHPCQVYGDIYFQEVPA